MQKIRGAYLIRICFVLIFLLLYFTISFYATSYVQEGILYPFYAWILFDRVPQKIQNYFEVRIIQYGNTKFPQPVSLTEMKGLRFDQLITRSYIFQMIQNLGHAVLSHSEDNVMRLRQDLEIIFSGNFAVYEIVEVTFNLIDRWENAKVIGVKHIATFITL